MDSRLHNLKDVVLAVGHEVHVTGGNVCHLSIVGVLWGKAYYLVT